jgi:hypothetical protein
LVISLDRFMADRLRKRGSLAKKLEIIPPWPHERFVGPIDPGVNPFRLTHGWAGKFIIMYSGLHTASNPLSTLLEATLAFADDPNLIFAFVGGGQGKSEVESHIERHSAKNVASIPYQPLEEIRYSLAAADVHVVSLGAEMVGIIHPCKIYSAMSIARPILFLGPKPSHIADLLERQSFGWRIEHGDGIGAIARLREIRGLTGEQLGAIGRLGQNLLREGLSQENLCEQFCAAMEKRLRLAPADVRRTAIS